jgi:hypothetical protein
MNTTRAARLVRTLGATPTRRSVAQILAWLALGGGLQPPAGASAGKRRCKPCQRKKHGKCRGKKPDGTPCRGDRECCDGACKTRCAPNELRDPATCGCCVRSGEPCPAAGPAGCCSKRCVGDVGGGGVACAVGVAW